MLNRRLSTLFAGLALALVSGCGSTQAGGDEAGSTTNPGGTGSGTGSETGTGSDTESETGDEVDGSLCVGSPIRVSLTGAASPPESCESFSFSGSLVEQIDANTWLLDTCGCNEDCESANPYELEIDLSSMTIAIPPIPWCLEIELQRNDDCYLRSMIVRDIGVMNELAWAAGTWEDLPPPGFEWMTSQATATTICQEGEDDGDTITGYRYQITSGDESIELSPEQSGVITGPDGPIEIRNTYASSSALEEIGEQYLSYFLVPQ